jgi:hypothetical protein
MNGGIGENIVAYSMGFEAFWRGLPQYRTLPWM